MCSLEGCRSTIELRPQERGSTAGREGETGSSSDALGLRCLGVGRGWVFGGGRSEQRYEVLPAPREPRAGVERRIWSAPEGKCLRGWWPGGVGGLAGLVGRAGFEPAKAEPSDLQSDPFGRSGTSPLARTPSARAARLEILDSMPGTRAGAALVAGDPPARALAAPVSSSDLVSMERTTPRRGALLPRPFPRRARAGASGGTRTRDRLITNQVLYQLSYAGERSRREAPGRTRNPSGTRRASVRVPRSRMGARYPTAAKGVVKGSPGFREHFFGPSPDTIGAPWTS